jgi:LmbE family N-acetylglucosaminyl deacetylase
MKNISRRSMISLSGASVIGSLTGLTSFSGLTSKDNSSNEKLKIIVAGAHPDDPESGCGGTMAVLAEEGHEVVSAYLTRGEAGIQGTSFEEAAKMRTAEALKACKILNVRAEFLGQIDGSCEITTARYTEMHDFFEREKPDIVFTHWPIDSHRDHRICSVLVYDAWISLGKKFLLFYFEVESGKQTQNFSPSSYVDISSVIIKKGDANMAHSSQNPQDWYLNIHRPMEMFRGLEYNCKYAEAFVRHNQNPGTLISQ